MATHIISKTIALMVALSLVSICLAGADKSSNSQTATQSRQSTAATILGTIGTMVPGIISNMAPLVLLFGLGALMVPALGLGALGMLREGRRSSSDSNPPFNTGTPFQRYVPSASEYYYLSRSLPSFSNINTSSLLEGLHDVFDRVLKAIDHVDKKYN
ncbi:hypothetical protein GZH46_00799 [Fragariocoptes setiger]|uniref:Uncharacterized protein n=1 Tax=Fragariocoptes setiger TaxID=1670756 RepID=A0ABQ7SB56_9ACAR|nr:hypothetical protein GZH46_00799 [Fragariocoptes setiger]